MDRRTFLLSSPTAIAASDKIRVGVIGTGGRGQLLTAEFKEIGAEMAAVCDVYEPNLQAGLNKANTGARAFYDRLGFQPIQMPGGGVYLGRSTGG